jgi:hypothetical protein
MDKKIEKKIRKEFPWFINANGNNVYVECGDGWSKLIYKWAKEVDNILSQKEKEDLYIFQIKEKFGVLNIYTSSLNEKVEEITGKYAGLSRKTCEFCGEEGKIRNKGHLQVLCEKHYKNKK